jgi:hypothetical protein
MDKPNDSIFLHLGRLEGKVDAILASRSVIEKRLDEHEERISRLERYRAWLIGVSAAIASAVAGAIAYLKGDY